MPPTKILRVLLNALRDLLCGNLTALLGKVEVIGCDVLINVCGDGGVQIVDDDAFGENVLAQVFSKGYKLGDKVLRPAMVKVAN